MAAKTPNFRSAIMGFNKMDVTDYLARSESEMEILHGRQVAADKTIESMKGEIHNLTRRLEILTDENCQLESANAQLRQTAFAYNDSKVELDVHEKALAEIRELKEKLAQAEKRAASEAEVREKLIRDAAAEEENRKQLEQKAVAEAEARVILEKKAAAEAEAREILEKKVAAEAEAREKLTAEIAVLNSNAADNTQKMESVEGLQKECESLRATVAALEKERKSVQDALISAQRMCEIVLQEAREKADSLVSKAEEDAQELITRAQQRNDDLQESYDRMLLDTGKMKSELIELYRRHLALLAEIPGSAEVPALEEDILETVAE